MLRSLKIAGACVLAALVLAGCQTHGVRGGPVHTTAATRGQAAAAFAPVERVKPKHCITQAGEMDHTLSLIADPDGEGVMVTGGPNSFRKGEKVDLLFMFGDERDTTDPFKAFNATAMSAQTVAWQDKKTGRALLDRIAAADGVVAGVCRHGRCAPYQSFLLTGTRQALASLRDCGRGK